MRSAAAGIDLLNDNKDEIIWLRRSERGRTQGGIQHTCTASKTTHLCCHDMAKRTF